MIDHRFFRLRTATTDEWLDGQAHLLRPDVDYPAVLADSDITRKLRNAAYYRKVRLAVTVTPEGILVQADRSPRDGIDKEDLVHQLSRALDKNDALEEVLREMYKAGGERLQALETKVQLLEEELSLLKRRS